MTVPVPFLDLSGATAAVQPQVQRAWEEVLRTSAFVGGPAVEQFERAWADACEVPYAVGVANGTDALVLALRALGIGPGDEVVVPANTFVATAEAVVLAGATPRFADVDPGTLLLTAGTLEAQLRPATRAVIPVHLYGQTADMTEIGAVAERAGIVVVEDAAQAHGATWDGRPAGSFGHAACFSFYPGKNLGAFGDAGAVVTSDPEVDRRLRVLRDHGRTLGSHVDHEVVGTNSRLDALQAAVLSAKLPLLERNNEARRAVMSSYLDAFDGEATRPVLTADRAVPVHHLAVVRVDDRDAARARLLELGIGTGVHYPVPCHRQPGYRHLADGPLPVAERAAAEVLSLPMFPELDDSQVEQVVSGLRVLAEERRGALLTR